MNAMTNAFAQAQATDGPRLKADPEFDAMKDKAYAVTAAELRQVIESIESLEAEKRDLQDQIKEQFADAKGRGFDTKALRTLVALRRKDANAVAEEEAILDIYKQALGMS